MKKFNQILLLLIVQIICFQQIVPAQDSTYAARPVKKKFSPDPLKATMLAVALPGMGQVYNRKYWKIPLVYAGFGALVYSIGFNTTEYAKFTNAYADLTDNIPQTNSYLKIKGLENINPVEFDITKSPQTYQYYKDQLLRYVDYYKRYRDLSYIGIGAWYLISILDANVDASLFNYDVSDNLDVAVMPVQMPAPGGILVAGINVSLKLNF